MQDAKNKQKYTINAISVSLNTMLFMTLYKKKDRNNLLGNYTVNSRIQKGFYINRWYLH